MSNVKIVQGTAEQFSIIHEADWPTIPRIGEYITYPGVGDELFEWEVTRVSFVADRTENLAGALVWVETSVMRPPRQTYQAMGFDIS
ncbi:hypothetical protein [Qipengyuania flava]|uniref:hypothetical protein n=1 Tax=Qipengyuania flava TaxID=192812 RepID=UPI00141B7873|nr:hypothetical protein [Qipengyuania flava]NIJ61666.1 hypothetical protein [Qipengyuania flava]